MEANDTEILLKLRKRLSDLLGKGLVSSDAFGMYQQTILQLHQECERRRQTCLGQAETLKRQAAAAESQAHAFSAMASIIFSVVNGYVELEERRAREEADRAKERAAAEAEAAEVAAAVEGVSDESSDEEEVTSSDSPTARKKRKPKTDKPTEG